MPLGPTISSVRRLIEPRSAALPYWQRAVALYDEVLAERPDDPVRQRNVALSEKYLGGSLDWVDRDEEAERHYRRALEIDERRYAQDPENRLARFDLAIDVANMATMTLGKNRLDEAYAWFSRSLEMRQKLSASDPADALAKGRIGYVQMRIAEVERRRGHFASAIERASDAVRILESVVDESRLVRRGIYVRPPIDSWMGSWRSFGFKRIAFKGANSRYMPGTPNAEWVVGDLPAR